MMVCQKCEWCGLDIEGDVMMPGNGDPMHTDCWTEWVREQKTEADG